MPGRIASGMMAGDIRPADRCHRTRAAADTCVAQNARRVMRSRPWSRFCAAGRARISRQRHNVGETACECCLCAALGYARTAL